MDLLVCPSCGRRSVVSGAGSLDEWKCARCNRDLAVVDRQLSRLSVMGDVRPVSGLGIFAGDLARATPSEMISPWRMGTG